MSGTPPALRAAMARAIRLEYWSIAWTISVVVAMGLAMGSSQAMKTAWIEDVLSLIPPIVFLVAAIALVALGGTLLVDSGLTLWSGDRATIAGITILGHEIWAGWIMVAVQVYSILVPLVLGIVKLPLAHALQDKVLFTDARTQKANWMTGVAGIAGVIGIGYGWWWADALAAGIIACDILLDGIGALRAATAELVDGAPRALDCNAVAPDAIALHAALDRRFPGAQIRMRETGRMIQVQIDGVAPPAEAVDTRDYWPGRPDRAWRLDRVSFVHDPRGDADARRGDGGGKTG